MLIENIKESIDINMNEYCKKNLSESIYILVLIYKLINISLRNSSFYIPTYCQRNSMTLYSNVGVKRRTPTCI